MLITANMATWSARKHSVNKAIDAIIGQVDLVRCYYNDYVPEKRDDIIQYVGKGDITDRGKFYGIGRNEIAIVLDDDLLVPPNYVEHTLSRMQDYPGHVVSYHGRKLKGKGLNYYKDHEMYHCLTPVSFDQEIDVFGTGVCAFNTNEFLPDVLSYPQDKMVDLIASIEARKKGVPAVCLKHNFGWLTVLTDKESIYRDQVMNCEVQNRLADELLDIKT